MHNNNTHAHDHILSDRQKLLHGPQYPHRPKYLLSNSTVAELVYRTTPRSVNSPTPQPCECGSPLSRFSGLHLTSIGTAPEYIYSTLLYSTSSLPILNKAGPSKTHPPRQWSPPRHDSRSFSMPTSYRPPPWLHPNSSLSIPLRQNSLRS